MPKDESSFLEESALRGDRPSGPAAAASPVTAPDPAARAARAPKKADAPQKRPLRAPVVKPGVKKNIPGKARG
jgi:hypothetical protein